MKKLFAIVVAMLMVMALSVSVFADEVVAFDNPDGEAFSDCINPWDFFGMGGFWGREAANVFDISVDEIKGIIAEGGATFTYVFSGSNPSEAPNLVFEFSDPQAAAKCTVVDLGDGKYEATGSLDELVAAWEANGRTLDEAANFLVQPFSSDFKLYSAKFSTGSDAVSAPAEIPAETTPDAPVDTTDDTPAAPAETGIVLAVLPMAVAAAALALSKKR